MPATAHEEAATITLEGGAGRLAVVADTHSRPHPAIHRHLEALRPAAILHAGDIGDLAVLEALAAHAPVIAVRGNIDAAVGDVPDQRVIDVATARGTLRILLTHIAVAGPRLRAEVARRARAAGASMVVCGHSHVPFIGRDQG
jgi:putative phosphoesterase